MIISCPECDRKLRIPDDWTGREVRCPSCRHEFVTTFTCPFCQHVNPRGADFCEQCKSDLRGLTPWPRPAPKPAASVEDDTSGAQPKPDNATIENCPHCGRQLKVPGHLRGAKVCCPACEKTFTTSTDGAAPVEWYYAVDQQQMGPVTWAALLELARNGTLKPTQLVWTDGMAQWEPAHTQAGLFADANKSAPASQPKSSGVRIFISYRRGDDPYATHHLRDRLAAHFGADSVFMDVDSIPFGVDFVEHLAGEVQKCNCFVAMIGDRWLDMRSDDGDRRLDDERDFVRIEIESALARRIPVIPVLVGQARMPREKDLPDVLKKLARMNAAEIRAGRDMEGQIARLIHAIEKIGAGQR
jgi:predicted Zn finger-like uncharacterized protein